MDKVSASIAAKREGKAKAAEAKVVEMKPKKEISGGESTQATN